eukprot:CAMPEP_0170508580 /NCGR_PEP_ID=MMETSP0208-20121228/62805_1 /TAXON_ID=197538 /ORGANISM="Strombidium inclinatum, Strain S3" /LENGTH=90 /DNA_ID=CAMNT_0010791565 /DNA_START=1639 /DNA_END=1908 /DNA_ORIENTATION=+
MDIDNFYDILETEFKLTEASRLMKVWMPSMAGFVERNVEKLDKHQLEITLEILKRDKAIGYLKEPDRLKLRVHERIEEFNKSELKDIKEV